MSAVRALLDCGDASAPCRAIALAEAGSPDATWRVAQGADMSAHSKILTGVLDHHQAGAVEVTREEIAGYVRHRGDTDGRLANR
jgi:hypothetical protein